MPVVRKSAVNDPGDEDDATLDRVWRRSLVGVRLIARGVVACYPARRSPTPHPHDSGDEQSRLVSALMLLDSI